MRLLIGIGLATALTLAGATAELKDAQGKVVGTATLKAAKDGVKISGRVQGLPDGEHAFHIHESGSCEAPEFKSAGGHFNPHAKQHGDMNPQGSHAGDLPNFTIKNGKGKIQGTAKGVTLEGTGANSLFKEGGTSLMIHASADDRKTDPAGNAGGRIACGVIQK